MASTSLRSCRLRLLPFGHGRHRRLRRLDRRCHLHGLGFDPRVLWLGRRRDRTAGSHQGHAADKHEKLTHTPSTTTIRAARRVRALANALRRGPIRSRRRAQNAHVDDLARAPSAVLPKHRDITGLHEIAHRPKHGLPRRASTARERISAVEARCKPRSRQRRQRPRTGSTSETEHTSRVFAQRRRQRPSLDARRSEPPWFRGGPMAL